MKEAFLPSFRRVTTYLTNQTRHSESQNRTNPASQNRNPEISNWTGEQIMQSNLIFRDFGFEMQDLSDFAIPSVAFHSSGLLSPWLRRCRRYALDESTTAVFTLVHGGPGTVKIKR